MKLIKKFTLLFAAMGSLIAVNACASTPKEKDDYEIKVAVLNGTTGFGIAPMIAEQKKEEKDFNAKIDIYADASLVSVQVISGSVDIAAVPTNLAAVLNKKTEGAIKVLAVNTLGVLYIIENGNTVNSLSDLENKTVYIPGLGSNPEYVLNIMLKKAGLEGKVTIDGTTYATPDALTAALTSGAASIGLLPEPKVTAAMMNNKDLRVAIDCTSEWKRLTDVDLVQGCLIARNQFIVDHEELTKDFLKGYKASVEKVNNDEDAAALIVEAGLAPKEALVKAALPRCNITYMTGKAMEDSLMAFWTSLYEMVPTSVGGAVPTSDIFYKA